MGRFMHLWSILPHPTAQKSKKWSGRAQICRTNKYSRYFLLSTIITCVTRQNGDLMKCGVGLVLDRLLYCNFFLTRNLIMCPAVVYSMTQATYPPRDQDLIVLKGKVPKTTIQITPHTKDYLDKIKEQPGVETYDQAILVLIRERRKHLPSSFGKLPDIGHFTREEDDSHRIRH
jgi:hypothetical protein